MTQPNELLPCQVSDAIELLESATLAQIERANDAVLANCDEMGVPKYDSAFGYSCALTAIIQSDAMNKASTIPTDGDAEWLRDMAHEIRKCGDALKAGFSINLTDGLERIANRLSIIPSAGDGLTLPREGLEDALFDALYDSVGLMGVATRRAAKACVTALEVHSALSIQTISGKGMREALEQIAGGFIPPEASCCIPSDWQPAYGALQKIAKDALAALVDQGERG